MAALVAAAEEAEREARRADARVLYERALRALGPADALLAVSLTRWIGRTWWADGDLEAAIDCSTASLAIAEALGDRSGIAYALNLMGTAEQQRGELDEALRLFRQASRHAAASGEDRLLAMVEQNLGIVATIRGDHPSALEHYRASLAGFRSANLEEHVAYTLNNLGMLYTDLRRWPEAEECFGSALESCTRRGDVSARIMVEVNRAELWIARRSFGPAKEAVETAFALAERTGDLRAVGELHKHYGVVLRETGEMRGAEEHLERAAAIAAERHDLLLAAETARERAELFWRQQRNRETLQSLNHAHQLFSALHARHDLADVGVRFAALERMFLAIVRGWGESIESKDRYTQGHCVRVADYACALAQAVGVDERVLLWFRMGALLHDVGKIVVPSGILNKPGRLTDEERGVMERHPDAGVELLAGIEFPWDVRPMVRFHHERWDGAGYPAGLRGQEIPLAARILCIADVFDALSSHRPYRPAFTPARALEIMRQDAGGLFDPELFAAWEELHARGALRTPAPAASAAHAP